MRVLLVPNTGNPAAVEAAAGLAPWLESAGFRPILSADDANAVGLASYGVPPTELGEPGLTVALGGDGTILKAVHLLGDAEVPVLGINLGRLGFMSGAGAARMRDVVTSALAGEGRLERRATLEAQIIMEGRPVGRYRALNEVVLGRSAAGRVIEVALDINGMNVATYACDGVVVATPTGSTAYALSAGGPIVSPDVSCQIVVPVAAHTLAQRAMVLSASDVVELRLPDGARREACFHVDGETMPCRQTIESVTVTRSSHEVLLLKLEGRDFFEVVRSEFLGR
ncbi:MAG: NAD(+)/NADH kinase [Coriobacteriia bacterium]|nr:NAD(+)/NADH kinase [Coriobacteriia bacterium]